MNVHAHASHSSGRAGALTLAASGVLFALFPLLRPWSDKLATSAGLAEAMASPWWVVSHLAGAGAFVLLALGALAVRDAHASTPGAAAARASVPLIWVGTGLTLLYFGAETFGLNAIAGDEASIMETSEAIRSGVTQVAVFGVGLLLVAAGMITLAIAVWRGGVLRRSSAVLFAAMIALYLPQFFLPPAGRIVHGLLTAAGAIWLAVALWRASRAADARVPDSRKPA